MKAQVVGVSPPHALPVIAKSEILAEDSLWVLMETYNSNKNDIALHNVCLMQISFELFRLKDELSAGD